MTALNYQRTLALTVVYCYACSIEYAIPETMEQKLLDQRERVNTFCPNGHQWHYAGKSLEEQLREAKAKLVHAQDQRQAAERQAAEQSAEMARLRKRASAGVCPCCKRSFQQLARHMKTKHPSYGGKP